MIYNAQPDTANLIGFLEANPNSQEFFREVISVMKGIPYAVIGSAARKCYLDHRESTKDIDILSFSSLRARVEKILAKVSIDSVYDPHESQLSITRNNCDVSLDFLFATGFEPENSAVRNINVINICNLPVRIAKPESLVRLLCYSEQAKHLSDLKDLLKSGKVNIAELKSAIINLDRDKYSLGLVNKILREIKEPG